MELVNEVASSNVLVLAITGAVWYTIWQQIMVGYTVPGTRPLIVALVYGLVTGRMEECMVLGATIQAMYLGLVSPRSELPDRPRRRGVHRYPGLAVH